MPGNHDAPRWAETRPAAERRAGFLRASQQVETMSDRRTKAPLRPLGRQGSRRHPPVAARTNRATARCVPPEEAPAPRKQSSHTKQNGRKEYYVEGLKANHHSFFFLGCVWAGGCFPVKAFNTEAALLSLWAAAGTAAKEMSWRLSHSPGDGRDS